MRIKGVEVKGNGRMSSGYGSDIAAKKAAQARSSPIGRPYCERLGGTVNRRYRPHHAAIHPQSIKWHAHHAEHVIVHTFFLESRSFRGEMDDALGEKLAEKEHESEGAGDDLPFDCSTCPLSDVNTKGTRGHQELAHESTNHIN